MEEKPTAFQRIRNVMKAVTVEPIALLSLTGTLMGGTTSQTLAIEKTCRVNLNLSDAICDAIRNQDTDDNAENERLVQEYVAILITYKTIIISVLSCILLIFAGGWMDITGRRKVIIFLPLLGDFLVQVNSIINVIFFYQLKVEYLMLFDAVLGSIIGGWPLLFIALFSYIADITTEENRTYRLGLVSFCITISMPIGVTLSGILLKNFGYLTVYIIALVLSVINLLYLTFGLFDPERTKENKQHDNRGAVYFLKTFFDPMHLVHSLKVVFRKTADRRALRLCILIGVTCILLGPAIGEASVLYMSTRYRFGWDELQYSIYQAYNMVLSTIGTMFCIVVISKMLGCHDSVLGIISCISKIAATFVFCFAQTGTVFFIGALVDILNGNAGLAIRSMFSKIVEPHEIAKLNSIVGIIEVLMPLAYVPMYTQVYTATMEFLPGFVFLFGCFLSIPPLLVFIWLLYSHFKSVKSQKFNKSAEQS